MVLLAVLIACGHHLRGDLDPPLRPAIAPTGPDVPADAQRWFADAVAAEALGDRDLADDAWGWVRVYDKGDPAMDARYGAYLTRTGRAAAAVDAIKPALARHPGDAALQLALGDALAESGHAEEAEDHWSVAAAAGEWRALSALGTAHADRGDSAGAGAFLDAWTGVPSTSAEALARGRLAVRLGRDGVDDLARAVDVIGADPAVGLELVDAARVWCRADRVRELAYARGWADDPPWQGVAVRAGVLARDGWLAQSAAIGLSRADQLSSQRDRVDLLLPGNGGAAAVAAAGTPDAEARVRAASPGADALAALVGVVEPGAVVDRAQIRDARGDRAGALADLAAALARDPDYARAAVLRWRFSADPAALVDAYRLAPCDADVAVAYRAASGGP